jgi:hypothetical protein
MSKGYPNDSSDIQEADRIQLAGILDARSGDREHGPGELEESDVVWGVHLCWTSDSIRGEIEVRRVTRVRIRLLGTWPMTYAALQNAFA